jgi:hypothetical protein
MDTNDGRLFARLDPPVNRRLRLYAAMRGQSLAVVLGALLDEHLPSSAELAAAITNGDTTNDRTS